MENISSILDNLLLSSNYKNQWNMYWDCFVNNALKQGTIMHVESTILNEIAPSLPPMAVRAGSTGAKKPRKQSPKSQTKALPSPPLWNESPQVSPKIGTHTPQSTLTSPHRCDTFLNFNAAVTLQRPLFVDTVSSISLGGSTAAVSPSSIGSADFMNFNFQSYQSVKQFSPVSATPSTNVFTRIAKKLKVKPSKVVSSKKRKQEAAAIVLSTATIHRDDI
jgi:hypothetical protein